MPIASHDSLSTIYIHTYMTQNVENRGRLQTERRRAVRNVKPEMDQMVAQNLLSMLLRPLMSSTKPGLLERGRSEYRR